MIRKLEYACMFSFGLFYLIQSISDIDQTFEFGMTFLKDLTLYPPTPTRLTLDCHLSQQTARS